MERFTRLTSPAVPVDGADLDTDQIIPARFLKKPRGGGYARYLFHDLRFRADGSEDPAFVLNREAYRQARILVAERNFGCGSAREGAVFALADYGFRAIVAPSFGDIFFNNCLKNGVLPVRLDGDTVAGLRQQLAAAPGTPMTVDLEAERVNGPDRTEYPFAVDPFSKRCLLEGLDEVALTLEHESEIAAFERRYRREMSWLFGAGG